MIQSFRLQLDEDWTTGRYIITGGEWFNAHLGLRFLRQEKAKLSENTGLAIIYPEHDLLWISLGSDKCERFKTLENFEKEFSRLPRWEATRYAVDEVVDNISAEHDADGNYGPKFYHYALFLFDCRTGQRLLKENYYDWKTGKKLTKPPRKHDSRYAFEPVPGREAEVERLRRGIEPMMRGEAFSFM